MSWKKALLIVVVGAIAGLCYTFIKRPLPVPNATVERLPQPPVVDGVSLSLLHTARLSSQHGFSVRGASVTDPFVSNIVAVLVQHPKGNLLIDAGTARAVKTHFAGTPLLLRSASKLTPLAATVEQLKEAGIASDDLLGVVLTHVHWDHVSGLADLGRSPVYITEEDQLFATEDIEMGKLFTELRAEHDLEIKNLSFEDGQHGPFLSSHDFFSDGTVVIVPMPGHTPGSVGVIVSLPSGKRYIFIGDTAWAKEGVDWPAEKPWISRRIVDADPGLVRDWLVLLHALQKQHPTPIIVPAHDLRVHRKIAKFPAFER